MPFKTWVSVVIAGMIGTFVKHVVNYIEVIMFVFVVSISSDIMCCDANVVFVVPFKKLTLPPGRICHLSAICFTVLQRIVELPFISQCVAIGFNKASGTSYLVRHQGMVCLEVAFELW
jgi:hypothetical protein